MRAVVCVSGGMDSTTLAYQLKDEGYDLMVLSFDYGQRHFKELSFARQVADDLGAQFAEINLAPLGKMLDSALTTPGSAVPEGHYANENMAATVVPNRNSIMLSIAFGVAVAQKADIVAFAAHSGDHPIYPDCRPEFVGAFNAAEILANEGFGKEGLHLLAPYINLTKADIVKIGDKLDVPYSQTWSCYKGNLNHCGRCGTCVERKEAFLLAKVADPTEYEDESFEVRVYRG